MDQQEKEVNKAKLDNASLTPNGSRLRHNRDSALSGKVSKKNSTKEAVNKIISAKKGKKGPKASSLATGAVVAGSSAVAAAEITQEATGWEKGEDEEDEAAEEEEEVENAAAEEDEYGNEAEKDTYGEEKDEEDAKGEGDEAEADEDAEAEAEAEGEGEEEGGDEYGEEGEEGEEAEY